MLVDWSLALLDDNSLTRENVLDVAETVLAERDRLGSHHVVHAALNLGGLTLTNDHWANAIGIPEADKTETSKHGSAGPTTLALLVHALKSEETVGRVDTGLSSLVELVGKDVQHELTVALGVDVAMGFLIQITPEFGCVDEVTVVSKADAVRGVDVERLRLSICAAASSRVSEVADTHVTREIAHALTIVENLGCKSVALTLEELAAARACGNTASILATVLKVVQRLLVSA